MPINRVAHFFKPDPGQPQKLPRFDFEDAAAEQRVPENSSNPVDPRLWTKGATVNDDTARKVVSRILNTPRVNPFTEVSDEILDYYDEELKGMGISTNNVFEEFSGFLFQGNEDNLKNQPSLLALKIQAQRGAKVSAQDLIKALTKIKL